MSEPIPESIPTSANPRFKKPLKKRAQNPASETAQQLTALFAKPDQEIRLPASSSSLVHNAHHSNAPPEIVANVQGSSAGAGSGEFHVYKASRRREYERLRQMDEELRKEEEGEKFDKEKKEREDRDRERTRKKREKREKMKMRKGNNGGLKTTTEEGKGAGSLKKPTVDSSSVGTGLEANSQEHEEMRTVEEVGVIIHDDD